MTENNYNLKLEYQFFKKELNCQLFFLKFIRICI